MKELIRNINEIIENLREGVTEYVPAENLSKEEITDIYNMYKVRDDVVVSLVEIWTEHNGRYTDDIFYTDEAETSAEEFYKYLDLHTIYESADEYKDAQFDVLKEAGYLTEDGKYDEDAIEDEQCVSNMLDQIEANYERIEKDYKPGVNIIVAYWDIMGGDSHIVDIVPVISTKFLSLDYERENKVEIGYEIALAEDDD